MLVDFWLCCCSCRGAHSYWKSWLLVEIETLRTTLTPFNLSAGFVLPLPWLFCMNQSYLGCISEKWQFSKAIIFFWWPYLLGWRIWCYFFLKQKLELGFFQHLLLQIYIFVTSPVQFLTLVLCLVCVAASEKMLWVFFLSIYFMENWAFLILLNFIDYVIVPSSQTGSEKTARLMLAECVSSTHRKTVPWKMNFWGTAFSCVKPGVHR